ncbi:MAG TPA: hypothetical protein VFI18_06680 [Gaiellales bacterium]|nr:hypothetical protein [Gaiellales bacterium]
MTTLAERTPVPVSVDCSSATVRLAARADQLQVEIVDDGVGGADPHAGSGLRRLRDRVEALEGSLNVDSEPGRGTRVAASIPA